MSVPADLRRLEADLPACPRVLLELLPLLDDASPASMAAMAALIESDMALAAGLVQTVNSAMFGLLRRVESVGEALRYLGTREVVAIVYQTALRAAFPATPAMERLWRDAGRAGLLMGRSAHALGLDPLQAHTAGLFARSGQAVLLVRLGARYEALLAALGHDMPALCAAEALACGVHHAAYGSALCARWGLAASVVHLVRDRVRPPADWLGHPRALRRLLALGAVTEALLQDDHPANLAESLAETLAEAGDCPAPELLSALQPNWRVWTALQPD
jgi:HD-like signal output (HDOD) protein